MAKLIFYVHMHVSVDRRKLRALRSLHLCYILPKAEERACDREKKRDTVACGASCLGAVHPDSPSPKCDVTVAWASCSPIQTKPDRTKFRKSLFFLNKTLLDTNMRSEFICKYASLTDLKEIEGHIAALQA